MTKEIGLATLVYDYGNNSEGPTCNYLMFILGGPSQCTLTAQAGRGNAIFNLVWDPTKWKW